MAGLIVAGFLGNWKLLAKSNSPPPIGQQWFAYRFFYEDGPIEWLQFIFLLVAAYYCFRIVKNYRQYLSSKLIRNIFLMFFVLLVFVAMEEISWGQRVLGIQTPQYIEKINVQKEITFHNIGSLQAYGKRLMVLFGVVGILMICARRWLGKGVKKNALIFILPPTMMFWLFCLITLSGVVYDLVDLNIPVARMFREMQELCVAMIAFFYCAWKYEELKIQLDEGHLMKKEKVG